MNTVNHSEIAAGSRHAPHNLEYVSAVHREAGTNEVNGITVSSDNLYQVAFESGTETYWVLTGIGPPLVWKQLLTVDAENIMTATIQEGGLFKRHLEPIVLADGEYYDLPDDSVGCGTFIAVEMLAPSLPEVAQVYWNINGVVTSMFLSSSSAITDAALSFCIFDNGSTARVKNNLGYSIYLLFDLDYCLNYLT